MLEIIRSRNAISVSNEREIRCHESKVSEAGEEEGVRNDLEKITTLSQLDLWENNSINCI